MMKIIEIIPICTLPTNRVASFNKSLLTDFIRDYGAEENLCLQ
jgi:hypothetical protein